jgi:D-glucosaminate-specific PTS system IID component
MMSSDVMQHELVERARERHAEQSRYHQGLADLLAGGGSFQLLRAFTKPDFLRLDDADYQKALSAKEEQVEALKRHLNFFNSEQTFGSVIQGISIAMEEQKTRGEPISDASITGIKTGLMGPLAGMGDSIIWAAVMPLLIAILSRSPPAAARWAVLCRLSSIRPLRWRSATAWCTKATPWDATR